MTTAIKICGITSVADAELAVACGVEAIGLNFWPGSSRHVDAGTARAIVDAVGARTLVVGVFVDASLDAVRAAIGATGIGCAQLHGNESPAMLAALLPHAYKALRVRDANIADEARRFGGNYLLLDAYSPTAPGGTGATFDWALAAHLARERKVTLAGGLHAGNVADAIRRVRPYCVDVASGVEGGDPRVKDAAKLRAFVDAVRSVVTRS